MKNLYIFTLFVFKLYLLMQIAQIFIRSLNICLLLDSLNIVLFWILFFYQIMIENRNASNVFFIFLLLLLYYHCVCFHYYQMNLSTTKVAVHCNQPPFMSQQVRGKTVLIRCRVLKIWRLANKHIVRAGEILSYVGS